jgi:hypothetical protein
LNDELERTKRDIVELKHKTNKLNWLLDKEAKLAK